MSDTQNRTSLVEVQSVEYLSLPALRFIGKDVVASGPEAGAQYGKMWGESGTFLPALDKLSAYASELTDPCALMHHNNQDATQQMHYLVGRFMKADTPVPDGFDFYDLPASRVCRVYVVGEFNAMISQAYALTRDRILADHHKVPYPLGYFHAELYPADNVPETGVASRLGYLMSCTL